MTVAEVQLSESVQTLIDSRLDTIDRMLLGRLSRQDRLAIVREVESQIFELIQEREHEELGRDDVLAVLARLDPPEAYLPDATESVPMRPRTAFAPRAPELVHTGRSGVAKASGILGLLALVLVLLDPVGFMLAEFTRSVTVMLILCGGMSVIASICSIVGLVLGAYARKSGVWAVVGMVTNILALMSSLAFIVWLIVVFSSIAGS